MTDPDTLPDPAARAEAYLDLAVRAFAEHCYGLAQAWYGKAWAAYDEIGDAFGAADAISEIARTLDENEQALRLPLFQQAYTLYGQAEYGEGQADMLCEMAELTNDIDGQRELYQDALTLYEQAGATQKQVDTLLILAALQDDTHGSQRLYAQARTLAESMGNWHGVMQATQRLGQIALFAGDYVTARHELERVRDESMARSEREFAIYAIMLLNQVYEKIESYAELAVSRAEAERLLAHQDTPSAARFIYGREVARTAQSYKDLFVLRQTYQQMILCTIAEDKPYHQSYLYWEWGRTEFYFAGHRAMGLALCRWAGALEQVHSPENTYYPQQLAQMLADAAENDKNPDKDSPPAAE